jgi:hypothetical protein
MKKLYLSVIPAIIALSGCQTVTTEKEMFYLSSEEVIMNANNFLNSQELNNSVEGLNNIHIVTCDRHEKFSCNYTVNNMLNNDVTTMNVHSTQSYIKEMPNKKITPVEHIIDSYKVGTKISSIIGKTTTEFDFKSEMEDTVFKGSNDGLTVFVERTEFLGMESLEQNENILYSPKINNSTSTLYLSKKEEKSFSIDKNFITLVYWN